MIDQRLNNRLRIIEKHLDLALDQLKEENNDGAKYLIYNALSTVGQLQEIVEYEEQKAFRLRRREGEEQEG
jgi:hemerythrin-like domain-containing protein